MLSDVHIPMRGGPADGGLVSVDSKRPNLSLLVGVDAEGGWYICPDQSSPDLTYHSYSLSHLGLYEYAGLASSDGGGTDAEPPASP